MTESNIQARDTTPYTRWEGAYPFTLLQAGRNVYQGIAREGTGKWDSPTGKGVGYITMDGLLQTLTWNVKGQHRPVRLTLFHEDASGNPSNVNYNYTYEYKNTALGKWSEITSGVSPSATLQRPLGETWERMGGRYRLQLQGTDGHKIYVTPYNQLLQATEARKRQGGGWRR